MTLLAEPPSPAVAEIRPETTFSPDRPLPRLCVESWRVQAVWLLVAAIVIGIYAHETFRFWAPADGGVDQNAYLLGGRMIAEHFSPRYTLTNPYQYVGGMFIRTSKIDVPAGDYYPKYPFGLPLIYASFFWIAGATKAASLAFLVSPVASIIAVTGMFFLARVIAGSFAGVCASILLGTSQLMIELSNNPNSHAACVAFIVWGMYFLVMWWQSCNQWAGLWLGSIAGFLLGYACLIRYSEGLLVLPIAVACASRLRWTNWRSYARCAIPALVWAIPVFTMLIYNKHAMGNWTGYDSTNESEGFTWGKFKTTWEQMIRTYYDMGAFFVLPFGLAGLGILCNRSWRLSAMLLMWLLPGTALYTAYYWSPDRGISYARFILTFIPVVMLGAAIFFRDGIMAPVEGSRWYVKIPHAAAVVVVVSVAAALGVYRSVHALQSGQVGGGGMLTLAEEHRQRQSLANIGQHLLKNVPVNSVLFADNSTGTNGGGNERPLNYIQFLRHWDVYSSDAFDLGGPRRGNPRGNGGANAGRAMLGNLPPDPIRDPTAPPTPRQKLQVDYLEKLYNRKSSSDLRKDQAAMMADAFKAGNAVYCLLPATRDHQVRLQFAMVGKYTISMLDSWTDLPPLPPDPVAENGRNNGARRPRNRAGGNGGIGGGNGGNRRGGRGPGGALNGGGFNAIGSSDATAISWELMQIKPAAS